MATPTYTPLWSTTLASATSTVSISGLPQTYRDLVLVIDTNWSVTNSSSWVAWRMNDDTGANYSYVVMRADGSSPATASSSGDDRGYIAGTSIGYGSPAPRMNITFQFQDYSASDKHKTTLVRYNDPANNVGASASRWASNSAAASITILAGLSFAAGSTFSLFGIAS